MQRENRIGVILAGLALCLATQTVRAAVVAVVSANSTVTTLSRNQVADIFLGKVARFPNGNAAVPVDQAEGTLVRDEFYAQFAGKSAGQIKAHWSKIIFTGRGRPPRTMPNSIEIKKLLAKDPNAIGYIEQSAVDATVRVLLAK
jgi:ABC-type phosphate transport system substrate-binding protein